MPSTFYGSCCWRGVRMGRVYVRMLGTNECRGVVEHPRRGRSLSDKEPTMASIRQRLPFVYIDCGEFLKIPLTKGKSALIDHDDLAIVESLRKNYRVSEHQDKFIPYMYAVARNTAADSEDR